eukprot:TRINITY_DN57394_c0_g1_i3.p1 TRINITY_DN57394_c0_g1~~TRINITY_DN57394_c0_g1_i3.p1  ORF type:complete len:102 (-),score=9.45 TRINITY_DN57394_c0_g1_i3:53-358(-)
MRSPPSGRLTTLTCDLTGLSSAMVNLKSRRSWHRTTLASYMAKFLPMQSRCPPLNGRKAKRWRPADSSLLKRSGRTTSGSFHSFLFMCMTYGGIYTVYSHG